MKSRLKLRTSSVVVVVVVVVVFERVLTLLSRLVGLSFGFVIGFVNVRVFT
jgi:hypothetical protein